MFVAMTCVTVLCYIAVVQFAEAVEDNEWRCWGRERVIVENGWKGLFEWIESRMHNGCII